MNSTWFFLKHLINIFLYVHVLIFLCFLYHCIYRYN
jgi:hypothetical protein